jgi:hypothetical protein
MSDNSTHTATPDSMLKRQAGGERPPKGPGTHPPIVRRGEDGHAFAVVVDVIALLLHLAKTREQARKQPSDAVIRSTGSRE